MRTNAQIPVFGTHTVTHELDFVDLICMYGGVEQVDGECRGIAEIGLARKISRQVILAHPPLRNAELIQTDRYGLSKILRMEIDGIELGGIRILQAWRF